MVLLVIIGGIYFINKKEAVAPVVTPNNSQVSGIEAEVKEVCYYKETKGEESTDYAFTLVNYEAGGGVRGIINWIPGEKDSLVGSYTGVVEDQTGVEGYPTKLNIIYSGMGEGILSKQQEIIIVREDEKEIKTGIGEKEQNEDEVWKFKDITKLTYENALPMVDCSIVPERIKTDYSKIQ